MSTTYERQFTAPSSMDTSDTAPLDAPSDTPDVPRTPDTPPVSTPPDVMTPSEELDEVFASALDHKLWDDLDAGIYNRETSAALYNVLRNVPDTPVDLIATLDRVNQRIANSANGTALVHEEYVLALAQAEVEYASRRHESAKLEALLGDNPAAKVENILDAIDTTIEQTTDEETLSELIKQKRMMEDFLEGVEVDAEEDTDEDREYDDLRASAVGKYYNLAASATPNVPEEVRAARDNVEKLRVHMIELTKRYADDNETMELVAKYLDKYSHLHDQSPAPDDEPQDAAVNPEVDQALADLEVARATLAALQAKRQKRVLGGGGEAYDTARNSYTEAVRAAIAAEMNAHIDEHGDFADDTAATAFIAMKTVDEAKLLDESVIDQYGKSTRFSKVLNVLAGRTPSGEQPKSKLAKFGTKIVKYGGPVGLLTASVMTGGALPVAILSGALATSKIYAHFETAGRDRRMAKTPGLIDQRALETLLDSTAETDDERIEEASSFLDAVAEKETKKQRFHARKRLLGSLALGGGVVAGSHLIGNWINPDGMHVSAADANPDVPTPDTPAPPAPEAVAPNDMPHTAELPVLGAEYPSGTFYANGGDGFYDILKNMGVESWQRDDILARASNDLINQGYAYKMPDGMPGIPRVGELPQGAIDILVKAAAR